MKIPGSCCCGAIKFELSEKPAFMGTCHCSRCRKVGASAIVFVKKSSLTWLEGKEKIQVFKAAKPYVYDRCFCAVCGSSLGEIKSDEDSFPIAANALDGEFDLKNQSHEFVGEKPSWYEICDDAPQNIGHPE